MKKQKLFSILILLFAALLITSCSKKDDNPTGPQEQAPALPNVAFKGPNTNSTDATAQQTKGLVESMNAYPMFFSGMFASTKPTSSGNEWKWVYSAGNGATVTYSASKNTDGSYTWRMIFNGVIDGVSYVNWKFLEGTTSADGKSGTWKIYDDNTTILIAEYNWSTNSAGVLNGTFIGYENGVLEVKMEITNRPDNSGELLLYDKTVLVLKSIWLANGTGEWWSYGSQPAHGTWQ